MNAYPLLGYICALLSTLKYHGASITKLISALRSQEDIPKAFFSVFILNGTIETMKWQDVVC